LSVISEGGGRGGGVGLGIGLCGGWFGFDFGGLDGEVVVVMVVVVVSGAELRGRELDGEEGATFEFEDVGADIVRLEYFPTSRHWVVVRELRSSISST